MFRIFWVKLQIRTSRQFIFYDFSLQYTLQKSTPQVFSLKKFKIQITKSPVMAAVKQPSIDGKFLNQ